MSSSTISIRKCDFCGYESNRSFNIYRHQKRIHSIPKTHLECCKRKFRTKGDYYEHVELTHPHTRKGYVSRNKYKIVRPYMKTFNLTATSTFIRRFNRTVRSKKNAPKLKDETIQNQMCESKVQKRIKIQSIVSMSSQRSLRIENMPASAMYNRTKMEFLQKFSVEMENMNFEEVPLKVFLDFPEIISFWKTETKDSKPKLMTEEPMKQLVLKSEKMEIKNTNEFTFSKNVSKEEICRLPLKKKILREIQGNEQTRRNLCLPPQNFLDNLENCSSEISFVLDPSISWPKSHQISDYLQEISFEIFKID